MKQGESVYAPECAELMDKVNAVTVVVIVIGGDRGNGFAIQSSDPNAPSKMPAIFRSLAEQVEQSNS